MSPMTPEEIAAEERIKAELRAIRTEGERYDSFIDRRDAVLKRAKDFGMSFRAIASEVGLSYQGVKYILEKRARAEERLHRAIKVRR